MAKDNALKEKSYHFAVRAVKLCRFLREEKGEYVLSKQIIRSGTSIGANIEESLGAQSDYDFIAKLHVALKESRETHYWIRLLRDTDYISEEQAADLLNEVNLLITLITKSLKTIKARINKAN